MTQLERKRVSRALTVVLAVLGALALWLVLGTLPQEGEGHEGPDEEPAKPIALPEHPVELQLTLGLKDEEQVHWEGQVKVSAGQVLAVGSPGTELEFAL